MVFHPHGGQTVGDLKQQTKADKYANKAGSPSLKRQEAPNLVAQQCREPKIQRGWIEAERGGEKMFRGRASATERPVGKHTGYANASRGQRGSHTVHVQVSPRPAGTSISHCTSNNIAMTQGFLPPT